MPAMTNSENAQVTSKENLVEDYRKTSSFRGVCDAYESGFGQGLQGRATVNPYPTDSENFKAWEYGHCVGSSRRPSNETGGSQARIPPRQFDIETHTGLYTE